MDGFCMQKHHRLHDAYRYPRFPKTTYFLLFTVTSTNPDALPPLPSLTITSTRYTVVDVTRGGVYTAVAPVPDTLPPVADQE